MRKTLLGVSLCWFVSLLFFVSCSDNDEVAQGAKFTFQQEVSKLEFTAEKGSRHVLAFHCDKEWSVETDVDWITVAPRTGKAGNSTITVLTKEVNATGEQRAGHILFHADGTTCSIEIEQAWKDIIKLEQTEYEFTNEGGELTFNFSTNVKGHFLLSGSVSGMAWIKPKKDANPKTRAMGKYDYVLTVMPNATHEDRMATFNILIVDENNYDKVLLRSETITVRQKGLPVDVTSDYSADKTVVRLQKHSKGNGVPIVLMGDGFADKDIAGGYYRKVMEKSMENLFTEEPVRSLREYFDVWAVTAVSQNNAFGTQYSTCFNCIIDPKTNGITGDENKVVKYVYAVPELASEEMLAKTIAVVIINTNAYAGVTGMAYDFGKGVTDFAIVFCPIVDGLETPRFREVLTHETIGHGLGKLYDEYAYEGSGTITQSAMAQCQKMQKFGWAQNVSLTGEPQQVPWHDLLADTRYHAVDAYGERLDIYEGACSYMHGAWRPTDESMMHSNMHGFNVPSRREIYKRTMAIALGDSWKYDYEEFVAFDQKHLPVPQKVRSRANASGYVQMYDKKLPHPRMTFKRLQLSE